MLFGCPQPVTFPSPFPCLFPLTCSPLPLPSAGPCSQPSAQPGSHLSAAGRLLTLEPARSTASTGPLESLLPLPRQSPAPRPLPLPPGFPPCSSPLLCPAPRFWPPSSLQPSGQTAHLFLHLSYPATSSSHLPSFGPSCKPSQKPGAPASGPLGLLELRELGTSWAQGEAGGPASTPGSPIPTASALPSI